MKGCGTAMSTACTSAALLRIAAAKVGAMAHNHASRDRNVLRVLDEVRPWPQDRV